MGPRRAWRGKPRQRRTSVGPRKERVAIRSTGILSIHSALEPHSGDPVETLGGLIFRSVDYLIAGFGEGSAYSVDLLVVDGFEFKVKQATVDFGGNVHTAVGH